MLVYTPTEPLSWLTNTPFRRPPPNTDHSADLWAPELHILGGRWYCYYSAGNAAQGNKSHRMHLLGGPPAAGDPSDQHGWEFLGPVRGLINTWAIDGTYLVLQGALYTVYSGWPLDNPGESDKYQYLYIQRMSSPGQADSQAVVISRPERAWEKCHDGGGEHGINEGPQWLVSPDGGWAGIIYSASGSWTNEYKMGILVYNGGDPLDPRSWHKKDEPLIQTSQDGHGPWGPGHGSFLNLDGSVVGVFHATDSPTDGWENRKARVQRVNFTRDGPTMGGVVGPLTTNMQVFMGEAAPPQQHQEPQREHHGLRGIFHQAKEKLREL